MRQFHTVSAHCALTIEAALFGWEKKGWHGKLKRDKKGKEKRDRVVVKVNRDRIMWDKNSRDNDQRSC